jgi:hypothetical protein
MTTAMTTATTTAITRTRHFSATDMGRYELIPFEVTPRTERIDISVAYTRHATTVADGITLRREQAVVDLFLHDPNDVCVGASGSERTTVFLSGTDATPGFKRQPIQSGGWAIGAGLYKIPEEGLDVTWTITLTPKTMSLFKGDNHVHTDHSDGGMSVADTIAQAARQGMDFVFLTDHNTTTQQQPQPFSPDITVLPGSEWTHYKGHAGFLGVAQPYKGSFVSNSLAETQARLKEAQTLGAMVVLNHPFCPQCPWLWGFEAVAHDAVEVWNGVMSERNLKALHWWHQQLLAGRRLPAVGGSDWHRPGLLGGIGMPCMCLHAWSREPEDLMDAMRAGNGYISYLPQGPGIQPEDAVPGGEWPADKPLKLTFTDLRGGDVLRLITDQAEEALPCPSDANAWEMARTLGSARFIRFEVLRSYAPGLPPMTAMVSNPIWAGTGI